MSNDWADLPAFTNSAALVPFGICAALRSDLEHFACPLNGVIDCKRFLQVTSHRLLDVDVFACVHCIDRTGRMPMIDRGNADGIDIFSLEQLAMVLETFAITANRLFGIRDPGF